MRKIEPQQIKKYRLRRGLSQQDLARKLGVSARAVSKWELGYSQPSANNLVALSQILDKSIECFLTDRSDT